MRKIFLASAAAALVSLLAAPPLTAIAADEWGAVTIRGNSIPPGSKQKFSYIGERSFEGAFLDFAVFVARGARPGRTLCVTSGIHGDELNSVEIARRAFAMVEAQELRGTLIVLPALNAMGFRTANRYLSDRRDLNRFFPGNPNGSVASILADAIFQTMTSFCEVNVDLHTGSNLRSNYPQIRADLENPSVAALAEAFGVGVVINGAGPNRSLRRELTRAGVPTIIYEAGPPYIFLEPEIEQGARGVRNVLLYLDMIDGEPQRDDVQVLKRSHWVRVPRGQGGLFFPNRALGDIVAEGERIGRVVDPLTDAEYAVTATGSGQIIGMALPQVVLSGYGLFHLGVLE